MGRGVRFAARADELVDALHLAERIRGESLGVEFSFPAEKEHAKLSTPVADVIVADDTMTDESRDPGERVAENRRPNVTDVHGLGDVRRAEIDDDLPDTPGLGNAETIVTEKLCKALGKPLGFEAKIDEAGASDFGRRAEIRDVEFGDDILGQLARISLLLLRENHRDVRLIVAKPGVAGSLNAGVNDTER